MTFDNFTIKRNKPFSMPLTRPQETVRKLLVPYICCRCPLRRRKRNPISLRENGCQRTDVAERR